MQRGHTPSLGLDIRFQPPETWLIWMGPRPPEATGWGHWAGAGWTECEGGPSEPEQSRRTSDRPASLAGQRKALAGGGHAGSEGRRHWPRTRTGLSRGMTQPGAFTILPVPGEHPAPDHSRLYRTKPMARMPLPMERDHLSPSPAHRLAGARSP